MADVLSATLRDTMADSSPPPAGPSDELSPLDYLLHRGEAYPATRSAFLGVEILDRPADWHRVREAMDRASRVVIRMRQKVVVPPLPVTPPRWVVDPDFDLDYHVRWVGLPGPGTLRQLLDLAEVTLQSPLDTSRPLWEAVYVEGLEGDRSALLSKFSHAITDGLGGIALFEQVYDAERDPGPRPLAPVPIPRDVTGNDLLRAGLRRLPETALSAGWRLLGGAVRTADRVLGAPGPTVAGAIGFASSARGVLGRYHEALGVPVDELPLALPVSLRTADDPAAGNRFTGVTIAAPVGESDPAERIRLVREQVIARRGESAIGVLDRVAPVLALLPDAALESVTNRITPPDIQASNVAGYRQETFLAGARVDRQYGMGPMPRVAMMAVLMSRAGICTLTVRYDTASFTDGEQLEKALQLGLDEVVDLGRPRRPTPEG